MLNSFEWKVRILLRVIRERPFVIKKCVNLLPLLFNYFYQPEMGTNNVVSTRMVFISNRTARYRKLLIVRRKLQKALEKDVKEFLKVQGWKFWMKQFANIVNDCTEFKSHAHNVVLCIYTPLHFPLFLKLRAYIPNLHRTVGRNISFVQQTCKQQSPLHNVFMQLLVFQSLPCNFLYPSSCMQLFVSQSLHATFCIPVLAWINLPQSSSTCLLHNNDFDFYQKLAPEKSFQFQSESCFQTKLISLWKQVWSLESLIWTPQ